jgi:HlyD family secretion protein
LNYVDVNKLKMDRAVATYAQPPRRRRSWRWFLLLAAAAAAGAGYWYYELPPEVQTTQVVSAWPSDRYVTLNSTGYVVARRKAAVASKGTGRVEWIGVSEGDFVKQGTVVAKLESRDVRATHQGAVAKVAVATAALTTARTELADATRDHNRIQSLSSKGLMTEVNLLDALSRLERSKAAIQSAEAALAVAEAEEQFAGIAVDYTEIRAPFDGVVIARSANVGDIVTPLSSAADAKGAVLTMADMGTLEVDADVSETSLSLIRVGQPCEIILDAFPMRRIRGEVSIIVPSVNRASATVTVKVRILDTDASVMPDMSARVGFLSQPVDVAQQKPVLAVNPEAIVEENGVSHVYTLTPEGEAKALTVTVGDTLGTVRAVEGDLEIGQSLILNPGRLQDGERVKLPERS